MYLLLNFVLFLIFGLVPAVLISSVAGRWDLWNVWAYTGILVVLFSVLTSGTHRLSPDLLKERIRPPSRGRVRLPSSQIFGVVSILQAIIAGLDQRFHWSDIVSPTGLVTGLLFVAIGLGLMIWSALVNPFFSPVTRIQADRGQRVISTGPYALLRHPGYAGFLLWMAASGLALNSLLSIIPIVVFALPVTVYQTMVEDRMLQDELAGYADYAAKVHYRLVPGLW